MAENNIKVKCKMGVGEQKHCLVKDEIWEHTTALQQVLMAPSNKTPLSYP